MPDPLRLLKLAAAKVPAVRYAVGLVGVAAAVSLVRGLLPGISLAAMLPILLSSILCIAVLIILSALAGSPRDHRPVATVFLWSVCIFVITLMLFTLTAIAFGWPPAWADVFLPREVAAGGAPSS